MFYKQTITVDSVSYTIDKTSTIFVQLNISKCLLFPIDVSVFHDRDLVTLMLINVNVNHFGNLNGMLKNSSPKSKNEQTLVIVLYSISFLKTQ